MVDVNSGKLIKSPLISIDNGQITAVQSNKQPSLKDGDKHIQLLELTLVPGLMDMHVHLTSDPTVTRSERIGQSIPRKAIKSGALCRKNTVCRFYNAVT